MIKKYLNAHIRLQLQVMFADKSFVFILPEQLTNVAINQQHRAS